MGVWNRRFFDLYAEDEYLLLSGIQHFAFCKRQWGLAYIELQWAENVRTVEGHLIHERAHDVTSSEHRGDVIMSRAMPIASRVLGISGECDVVEFHKEPAERDDAVFIPVYDGVYSVVPVEYKRGAPKSDETDALQLCAQGMCLEEMLSCSIRAGYLYYAETRRRQRIDFTEALRERVKRMFDEMHDLYRRGVTPRGRRTKSCNACSLRELCLPMLEKKSDVKSYIDLEIGCGEAET